MIPLRPSRLPKAGVGHERTLETVGGKRLFASQLISAFGDPSRSPKFALKVRAGSIPPVGELTLDLAVAVEMEYIDALPTEFVSVD